MVGSQNVGPFQGGTVTPTVSIAPRRAVSALLALLLAVAVGAVGATGPGTPAGAAVAAPTPTPARSGKPTTMAALGDSITQATGTGEISKENPKNSWSTGWEVNSVRARLGITTANAQNLSANGARMGDADTQVTTGRDGAALRPTTQYVTIEMGGNDLCRDSVAAMTSVSTYRTQLREALAAIKARAPQALVFVMSVPDIYNLWYIRGAPQNGTYHPEPESDQANGLNGARFYWGQSFFPCQSLLTNPDSYAQADRDRRAAVRQRTIDYNAALRAECATWLRCRFDGNRLFDMTSNRVSPPHGPLLPHSQWQFKDGDISRNEGVGVGLCPVQGVFAGGCGDHFHPSKAGQLKLADAATAASYQWSDTTVPTVGLTPSHAARPNGTHRGPVTVTFSGTDAAGLRGQEVRIHRPDGTVTPWTEAIGVHPAVTISQLGVSHVEARSLDVNGNLSASRILTLDLTTTVPATPGTPALTALPGQLRLSWAAPVDDGGTATTGHQVELLDPAAPTPTTVLTVGAATTATVPVPDGRAVRARVRTVNAVGPSAWSGWSSLAVPPFADPAWFIARVRGDLAAPPLSVVQQTAALDALGAGTKTPAALTAEAVQTPTWEDVIGPVSRLYRAYYLREAEADGLQYWEGRRRRGMSLAAMAQQFSGTPEFRTLYGSLTDREFIRRVYVNVLEREPDADGWDYWTEELAAGRFNRGRMMLAYSESPENRTATRSRVLPVVVWWGLLDRLPTADEHLAAVALLDGGGTLEALVEQVFTTTEWADEVG
jgi:lysophospholipase L1-like esterase